MYKTIRMRIIPFIFSPLIFYNTLWQPWLPENPSVYMYVCFWQSVWTTITVTVTNVNDNAPEIVQREITVNVERTQGAQVAVIEVCRVKYRVRLQEHSLFCLIVIYLHTFLISLHFDVTVLIVRTNYMLKLEHFVISLTSQACEYMYKCSSLPTQ